VTWWKRAERPIPPEPEPSAWRRDLAEVQSDVTVVFDLLQRIENRLKQRESRASRDNNPDRGDRPDHVPDAGRRNNVDHQPGPALVDEQETTEPTLTKEQVRELARQKGMRA
jgi:hypothetical protein